MIHIENKHLIGYKFIDLFAGIGGFRIALESFGAECVYSSEWDKFAQLTYLENFGELPDGDITKVDEKSVPDHDILCAGFPCQAFSISGKRLGFEDSRGTLFFDVGRIIKEKMPMVIIMENVKNYSTHDNGITLKVTKEIIEEMGYSFFQKVLNASDYGIPQKRERIYMICFRNDLNVKAFKFPESKKLNLFLEDLLIDESLIDKNFYIDRDDIVWRDSLFTLNENNPIRVGTVNKGGQGERIYSPKGVAITLSANGGGVFAKTGGYVINNKLRKLHPRECARVMGFPDSYKLVNNKSQQYKQFGNSVVIDVLQYIIKEVIVTINQTKSK